jgi:8-oxo-dGTP pyrophosphatase MutT (NUDIX family)
MPHLKSADAFIARARPRLLAQPDLDQPPSLEMYGDHDHVGFRPNQDDITAAIPAAVLAPVVLRPEGARLILTERSSHLNKHSGQVAFPGGRIDKGESPGAAALREAWEEIGLDPALVTPIGYLPSYFVRTGYRIIALVAVVDAGATFNPNPAEVARVFEAPLAELLDPGRLRVGNREWEGATRYFYEIDHDSAYIWGATAGMIRMLSERLST